MASWLKRPGRFITRSASAGCWAPPLLGAFPHLHARADGTQTVLTGPLADQAALYGLLAQLEALGLELLEVRRAGG